MAIMDISEKATLSVQDEEYAEYTTAGITDENLPSYDDKETKRILRKVDYRLLPVLTFLYVLSFLDRGNIGNAKVAGMTKELRLTDGQYNLALTVFFITYSLFEVPSNVVLKMIRPSLWISILVVSWGVVMTLQGIVQGFHGLIITRLMLGLAEAGFFPAATYLLTTWYCRFELQTRLAVFYSAASVSGAFSGLLAFAIENMDGVAGLGGWRWIFILEGIVTVLVGCTLRWTLPDSPEMASFLTPAEKEFINRRLKQDTGTSAGQVHTLEGYKWAYLKSAFTEWKIFLAVIIWWGNTIPLYSFTYSAPTIILGLSYSAAHAQLLTIPIYFVGMCSTIFFSYMADKHQTRWPFIIGPYSVAIIGFIGLLAIPHPRFPGLTYAFLFAIPAGVYPPLTCILAWMGNNLAPSWKRAPGMAFLISMGNLGGLVGSNIYLENQKPHYWLGCGFCLGILLAAVMSTAVLRVAYARENEKRDLLSETEVRERYTENELLDMGDKSPLYRYVV